MDCTCSPDVSDCPHCHPEMWLKSKKGICHWKSKLFHCKKNISRKANKSSRLRSRMTYRHKT